MELRDYPRPRNDTGIGVHWSAGFPAMVGLGRIRDDWLPELVALGVKWVKLSRHDGGTELDELLLKNDIMPVVRVYRPVPNPGVLDGEALRLVREHVAAGVRYFEFNNEPDLGAEWQHGTVPMDGLETVARNAIIDMEAILACGGYPGIPAVSVGCRWDLPAAICRLGRRDLLAEPVWQAVHNYSLNHPLDYPYDAGNQKGAPYGRDFYSRLASEVWGGDAWSGWSLEHVNEERRTRSNPGATAVTDSSCWQGHERQDQLIRDQIGRSLPVLSTENGYVVGERQDPRYPATTPQLHMAQTLEACRVMMGSSSRFAPAPDYYFCSAFWLLGNYTLGHWAPAWEGQAWYSERWSGGCLPVVAALKAEPKQARVWQGTGAAAGRVAGALTNIQEAGAGLAVKLVRDDGWSAAALTDDSGRYAFIDVPMGHFRLMVVDTSLSRELTLSPDRPEAAIDFDLSGITVKAREKSDSSVRGTVTGGAGRTVRLARRTGESALAQPVSSDGSYRFTSLPAGNYMLTVDGSDVGQGDIVLDGSNMVTINLAIPGWGWEVTDGGASPGFGVVRCRVKGQTGQTVRIWTTGWEGYSRQTGHKPEYGQDVCEFAPLGAGAYVLQPEGLDVRADTTLDGTRVQWVTFADVPAPQPDSSVLTGRVPDGAGRRLTLAGPGGTQTTAVAADGSYRFAGLIGGSYSLHLRGTPVTQDGIALDGHNQVALDLALPAGDASVLYGTVSSGAGKMLHLQQQPVQAAMAETTADAGGNFRFERLAAGKYSVLVMGGSQASEIIQQQSDIELDGSDHMQVNFTLPGTGPGWSWYARDGGAGKGFSLIICRVLGEPGRQVRLWTQGWSGITMRAGSKLEYGPDACEFAPLGAGAYYLDLVDTGVRADIQLQADRTLWVYFQPSSTVRGGASVVSGTVSNGEGRRILLSGPLGRKQAVVTGGRYRIDGLPAGNYEVSILSPDMARSAADPQHGVALDGSNQVIVDFVLPGSGLRNSRVRGRLTGAAGRLVTLDGPDGRRATFAEDDGSYLFSGLAPGSYRLGVEGGGDLKEGVLVDGLNEAVVDHDARPLPPDKSIQHYLLVGNLARSREDFLAVLRYVGAFRPVVGTSEAEARRAQHVTILGSANSISAASEQELTAAGCLVQRIEANYAEALCSLLERNMPYEPDQP